MRKNQKNLLVEKILENAQKNSNLKIFEDTKNSITFGQLLKVSLSNVETINLFKGNYIPILIDRNIDSLIAILSVILSKKTFCPISPSLPYKRIKKMSQALSSKYIINCSNKNLSKLLNLKEIKINKIYSLANLKNTKINIPYKYDNFNDIFYVLFTSGSTGSPKGVKLSYANIHNTLLWSKKYLHWSKQKIGIATQFSFDISMFDVFSGLFFNVPSFIFSNPSDPFLSLKEINKNKVTSIFSVPTFFSSFMKFDLLKKKNRIKRIISGGDFFPPKDILYWKNNTSSEIINVWGPTETSIVNTMYKIKNKDIKNLLIGKNQPVGKSQKEMEINIIKNKKILKKKEIGEICMSGKCVASGYLGHIKNKRNFIELNGKSSYLTGDIGYFDSKGYLYILGRKDNTVKISGYRVDTLEIQNIVNKIDYISNSLVFALENYGQKMLCLAIETKKIISIEKIKNILSQHLPQYSMPKKIKFFEKFPLNLNFKIDRNNIQKRFYEE